MSQGERDRLVVLQKPREGSSRKSRQRRVGRHGAPVRRMLKRLKDAGDKSVIHGLRGRASNRRLSEEVRQKAVRILSQEVYHVFGPTLASECLAQKHGLRVGREALRQIMQEAGLWRSRKQ